MAEGAEFPVGDFYGNGVTRSDHHVDETDAVVIADTQGFGGERKIFDAYISCCRSDMMFVQELIEFLEKRYGLELCVKERDLLAGTSAHTAVAHIIKNRCRKVIIVMSSDYLSSPECDFQTKVTLSVNKTPIILMYKNCVLPPVISFMCCLRYEELRADWFWDRLKKSLIEPPVDANIVGGPVTPSAAFQKIQRSRKDSKPSIACRFKQFFFKGKRRKSAQENSENVLSDFSPHISQNETETTTAIVNDRVSSMECEMSQPECRLSSEPVPNDAMSLSSHVSETETTIAIVNASMECQLSKRERPNNHAQNGIKRNALRPNTNNVPSLLHENYANAILNLKLENEKVSANTGSQRPDSLESTIGSSVRDS